MRVAFFFSKSARRKMLPKDISAELLLAFSSGIVDCVVSRAGIMGGVITMGAAMFYTLSIAYGGVPIFLPFWRPW